MDLLKPGYLLDEENEEDMSRFMAIENGLKELSTDESRDRDSKKMANSNTRFIGGHPVSLTLENI